MSSHWQQKTILLVLVAVGALTQRVSAHLVQTQASPSEATKSVADPAPSGIPVPGLTICDSVTFANCHKVEGVVPPRLIHSEDPKFPAVARRLHIQGLSVMQLIVDGQGRPQNVMTIKSAANGLPNYQRDAAQEMDANAVKAVKKFRFRPAMLNGNPVAAQITVEQKYHVY
jgi:TonB family protein